MLAQSLGAVAGARAVARSIDAPGGSVLAIDLVAPPEGIDELVRQTSELVARLGRGEVNDAELTAAGRRYAMAEREELGDPVARLTRLFAGRSPTPAPAPTPQAFRALAAKSLISERLAVTVVRPE